MTMMPGNMRTSSGAEARSHILRSSSRPTATSSAPAYGESLVALRHRSAAAAPGLRRSDPWLAAKRARRGSTFEVVVNSAAGHTELTRDLACAGRHDGDAVLPRLPHGQHRSLRACRPPKISVRSGWIGRATRGMNSTHGRRGGGPRGAALSEAPGKGFSPPWRSARTAAPAAPGWSMLVSPSRNTRAQQSMT